MMCMVLHEEAQELIKHLSEATECLESDATDVYSPNHHKAFVEVRGLT